MPSAAEQLASSVNFGAIAKATELKQRIIFTLLALIVYRLGTYLPIPGINPGALDDIFNQNTGGILGMFDMFAGGALSRMSIFALNIMPYFSVNYHTVNEYCLYSFSTIKKRWRLWKAKNYSVH